MSGYTSATASESIQKQLESNLLLQGAIAIQDDLAADVMITIKQFQAAGIHVWILTGDKAVTAEAIARSAGLVDSDQPILRLTTDDCDHLDTSRLIDILLDYNQRNTHEPILVDEYLIDLVFSTQLSAFPPHMIQSREQTREDSLTNSDELPSEGILHELFLQSLYNAQAVIIARMRKDQKQMITKQLKEYGKRVESKCNIRIICRTQNQSMFFVLVMEQMTLE